MKLLEEEEKDKREEEERKERKRMKEREKKLRRKERLKGKDKDGEKKSSQLEETPLNDVSKEESVRSADEELNEVVGSKSSVSGNGRTVSPGTACTDIENEEALSGEYSTFGVEDRFNENTKRDVDVNGVACSFTNEQADFSHGKMKSRKGQVDQSLKSSERHEFAIVSENGPVGDRSMPRYHNDNCENHSRAIYVSNRQLKANSRKSRGRNLAPRSNEKLYNGNRKMNEKFDAHSCGCNQIHDYRGNTDLPVSAIRPGGGSQYMVKSESALDVSKHFYHGSKCTQADYSRQSGGRLKNKAIPSNNNPGKDSAHFRKVWEPLESQKRCSRSNSASDITLIGSGFKVEEDSSHITKSSCELCSSEDSGDSIEVSHKNSNIRKPPDEMGEGCRNEPETIVMDPMKAATTMMGNSSVSKNCLSSLSEVDNNAPSSNCGNPESSSTSDSEDASQYKRREALGCKGVSDCHKVNGQADEVTNVVEASVINQPCFGFHIGANGINPDAYPLIKPSHPTSDLNSTPFSTGHKNQGMFTEGHQYQNLYWQMFQNPSNMGYYTHQNLVSWAPLPASGFYRHANNYLYPGPLNCGLDANQIFCLPYEAMQHLTPMVINSGPGPFSNPAYQPVAPVNGIYAEEPPKQSAGQEVSDVAISRDKIVLPRAPRRLEHPQRGGKGDISTKACQENSGFSMFHFDLPIALSSVTKSSEDGTITDIPSFVSTGTGEGFHNCDEKETTVEEYNLFAASNGMKFSIF